MQKKTIVLWYVLRPVYSCSNFPAVDIMVATGQGSQWCRPGFCFRKCSFVSYSVVDYYKKRWHPRFPFSFVNSRNSHNRKQVMDAQEVPSIKTWLIFQQCLWFSACSYHLEAVVCVLACTVCVWGKDWWRCWAIWMTGHANFQVKSVKAYRIKKMSTACLVTTLCLHLTNSNGGSFFSLSLA